MKKTTIKKGLKDVRTIKQKIRDFLCAKKTSKKTKK